MPSAASLLVRAARDASRAARSAARAASRAARSAAVVAAPSRSARSGSPGAISFGPPRNGLGGDSCSYRWAPGSQAPFSGIDFCADPVSSEQSLCTSGLSSPDVSEQDLFNKEVSELDFVEQEAKLPSCRVDLPIHENDLASDEALWSLYERWCKVFNQERDSDEMARRFNIFKDNVLLVHRVNNAGLPYELGLNEFSDGKLKELCYPRLADHEYFMGVP